MEKERGNDMREGNKVKAHLDENWKHWNGSGSPTKIDSLSNTIHFSNVLINSSPLLYCSNVSRRNHS